MRHRPVSSPRIRETRAHDAFFRALFRSQPDRRSPGQRSPARQAEESGFVEGAKVNLNLRNFYINRNFTNPTKAQGKAEEWTQSFILDAKSGFTQGTVGFGMDVLGLYSVKLDGGKGTGGTQLLPLDQ